MNLEQLRGFVEIARVGRFTEASKNLHLTQPTLSRQIAALENDLGAPLFSRGTTGARLTPAGESLLPRARRILSDAEAMRRDLDELAGLERGRVRLGATPTLCISLVAETLPAFHAAHPAISLALSERGSLALLDELAAGELDLALVTTSRAGDDARVHLEPLLTEELVVVSSTPLPRPVITLAEVAELPQVVFSDSYDLRGTTDAAFESANLSPRVVLEGAEMDAVLRFVERGLGVAIVPAIVLHDRPALRALRLAEPSLTRTISLAQPAGVAPTAAGEALRRAIVDAATALARRAEVPVRLAND